MRFLADESCDFAVVRALRSAGHDVVAVRDTDPGAPDEAVIGLALQESRVLLTEDKDFGQLVFASAGGSAGVIFIRFPASARRAMAQTVVQLIESHAQKVAGRFVVVQPGRIRISARTLEPWYKVATPRKEVREGRSFNPDEFAIALEQVVAGTAPEDYRKPDQFFARTCFTRALREHARYGAALAVGPDRQHRAGAHADRVVRRVAKDLIANDETEISEVVRRRLFQDLGSEKIGINVVRAFADWRFVRRAQLPPEWTAVDAAATETKAREFLQRRFEACYPFHPATLSVFQRKWQSLAQYQQTRGTLAMLAQWISLAAQDAFRKARTELLITLGSAPLAEPGFRSVVLGQLGESRLIAAIDTDIAGEQAHARALDADTKGPLRDIHRRVGTSILFESSGGQTEKVAHLPELRFALGEPELDTTSIDNAAFALEDRSCFVRKAGTDGFRIGYQPTMKKVVSDRRASLDDETEIKPAMRKLVENAFRRGASIPVVRFPRDGVAIPDTPKLTLVVADPELEWSGAGSLRQQLSDWTKNRGKSPRLYPGALVWGLKKPGRDLREKVELALAWRRVWREVAEGTLGGEFDRDDRADLQAKVKDSEEAAKDEVWGRLPLRGSRGRPTGGWTQSDRPRCGTLLEWRDSLRARRRSAQV